MNLWVPWPYSYSHANKGMGEGLIFNTTFETKEAACSFEIPARVCSTFTFLQSKNFLWPLDKHFNKLLKIFQQADKPYKDPCSAACAVPSGMGMVIHQLSCYLILLHPSLYFALSIPC